MTDRPMTGKRLNDKWGVGARHALYFKDGNWFHVLKRFPGALFDPFGYVLFQTESEYKNCPQLHINVVTNTTRVPKGISSIVGYVNKLDPVDPTREFPKSSDFSHPKKVRCEVYRSLRDTALAREVKHIHRYRCQLCGTSIDLGDRRLYAEAHHIKPLGAPHNGPDTMENIICVCPNHHAQLDYGGIKLFAKDLCQSSEHKIGAKYLRYHNERIYGMLRRLGT